MSQIVFVEKGFEKTESSEHNGVLLVGGWGVTAAAAVVVVVVVVFGGGEVYSRKLFSSMKAAKPYPLDLLRHDFQNRKTFSLDR